MDLTYKSFILVISCLFTYTLIITMNNPIPSLKLDSWYKVVISICTVVFLACASGLLPNLPTKETLQSCLGGIFLGLGEWKNHPLMTVITEVGGQRFKGEGYKRAYSLTGTILCLFGLYLLYKGIWHLI
ncbi:hypothetical protein HGT70_04600 [Rosenbergiella collisarenosi]|uniref:hypothetical protein n=1 Tax=Rosenbergiella collisarenosi TaxID=1544695 RepID=UPI001BD98027|nr:hypothetical protein [Rosenbergiella collisarenosi]MBT0720563.1 hypothetical protein [Rosenbergiella collisarenosi]